MDRPTQVQYEFGPFRLNPAEQQLLRDGDLVKLEPKLFDVLLFMVQRSGRLIEKSEFMDELWKDRFVNEGNLARYVYNLRMALGKKGEENRYIETVHTRGYRFVATVKERIHDPSAVTGPFEQAVGSPIVWEGGVALVSTIIITVPPRALLATFNLTTTQVARMGIRATFEGILNGFLGVFAWTICIGGGLLVWWFLSERRSFKRGSFSPLVGAIAGLVGGIVNSSELILTYGSDTLIKMNWLPPNKPALIETITGTGVAFILPVYGLFIGLGVGEAARRMLEWWERDLKEPGNGYVLRKEQRAIPDILYRTMLNSWVILLPLMAATVAMRGILTQMPHPSSVSFGKLLGEGLSLYFGGVGLVIGLFVGRHLLKKGLHIAGREG